ncbi:MAG: hypothetical protein IKZ87_00870, partial [Actinomycetaceae bacterium]|nr:hypothetical protein [Actinomycetaceae bacterium]
MSSPIMDSNPYFRAGAVTPNRNVDPNAQYGAYQNMNVPNAPVQVDEYTDYNTPFADAYPVHNVATMTYNDALQKTGILLGVTIVSAI